MDDDDIREQAKRDILAQARANVQRLAARRAPALDDEDDPLIRWAAGMPKPEPPKPEPKQDVNVRVVVAAALAQERAALEERLAAHKAEIADMISSLSEAIGQVVGRTCDDIDGKLARLGDALADLRADRTLDRAWSRREPIDLPALPKRVQ